MNVQTDLAPRHLYMSPAECQRFYRVPYQFREIQIHWWDSPAKGPTHDGIVSYGKRRPEGSVNYIVSGGRITMMVPEEMCAITSQNGNPYGIKLECSPYGTDADYQTIAWMVADIWKRRGRLPLVPHKKYWNTACPGSLDLGRIEREAEQIFKGGSEPMIADADNEYWRWNKLAFQIRGRNFSRDEFRAAAVGRNWLNAMEILSDDGEADRATQAQQVGLVAVNDNWQGQIGNLTNQLGEANKKIGELSNNPTPEDLKKVQETLQACEVNAKTLSDQLAGKDQPTTKKPSAFIELLLKIFRRKK